LNFSLFLDILTWARSLYLELPDVGKIMKHISKFITSAQNLSQYPEPSLKEVAIVGRSNAGKSSLLNSMLKRDIVKVSSQPGKTQLINFFSKEEKYIFVDLPGYGFAGVSESQRRSWREMIEEYLVNRETLTGVVLVIDSRRNWEAEEDDLRHWLHVQGIPLIVAITKADKLSKSEIQKKRQEIIRASETEFTFATSSEKNIGIVELENFIYNNWIKGNS
jgi:GTP-binding protein